jgi:ankyrin repeat protein
MEELCDEYDADIDVTTTLLETPLFLAVRQGHSAMAHLLISIGANPTIANNEGKTPLALAKELGHTRIVQLLNDGLTHSAIPATCAPRP